MLKKKQCETESNWYKRYIDCPISQSKITKIQVQRVYSDTNHEQKNLILKMSVKFLNIVKRIK